jgi:hypothetical protein
MTLDPVGKDWQRFAQEHLDWLRGEAEEDHPDPLATNDIGATELAIEMARSAEEWVTKNKGLIAWVHRALFICFVCLIVQTALWATATVR